MKIYSKTGDNGETSLCGGQRVRKDCLRVEVCGAIDELNAALGVALTAADESSKIASEIAAVIERIQRELFEFGAELASRNPQGPRSERIGPRHVAALEMDIDRFADRLEPLDRFLAPGGSASAAQLHVARTVCRRSERRLVTLAGTSDEKVSPQLLVYLNRLGDLLFVLARAAVCR